MSIKTNSDLRKTLIDTLEDVRAGKVEPKTAREVVRIASAIIESARLDLDVLKYHASSGEKLDAHGKHVLQLVAG